MSVHPIHPYAPPYPTVHLHVSTTPYVSLMSWDLRGICTPHMSWGLWGALVHLSGISVSVNTPICLSVHDSHTSCFPSLWVATLLDWIPMDVWYASFCCSFLCSVFIMSQASTTMAMTTTPPVICVFQYLISPLNGYHGPILDGASNSIRSV